MAAHHLSLNLFSAPRPALLFCAFGIGMPRSENSNASSREPAKEEGALSGGEGGEAPEANLHHQSSSAAVPDE